MADFTLAVLKYLFLFIVIWVVLSYFVSPRRTFDNIVNTWYQPFANQQFSSQEFYKFLEQALQEKKIKNISINRVTYGDMFSTREYLQVLRNDQLILVCAATFGTDFFVSYRQGQPVDFIQDMIFRIPKIGPWLATAMYSKSFYKQDTDVMYKESVHQCVLKAISYLTSSKAERAPLIPSNSGGQSDIEYA